MATGLNRAYLLGNLGQNPELRQTTSGQSVLSLRMATNERYKDNKGEWIDRPEWHTVVVWGKRAEALAKILAKGSPIMVEGRIRTRKWEDKEGKDRYTTEIVAREVFLTGRKGDGNSPPPPEDDYGYDSGSSNDQDDHDDAGAAGAGQFADDEIPF